jgi:Spy/CpxP family protein refolding chaperone
MIRKAIKKSMIVALLLATPCVFAAQDEGAAPRRARHPGFGPGGPGRGPGPGLGRIAEDLGLSDEQKAQLEALRARQKDTLQPLAESARQAHEAFRAALEAESPDAAAVGQAALAMKEAEKKMKAAHDAAFEEMKSVLTPEQRQKLEQMHRDRPPRPWGPGGFGGPGHRGPGGPGGEPRDPNPPNQ